MLARLSLKSELILSRFRQLFSPSITYYVSLQARIFPCPKELFLAPSTAFETTYTARSDGASAFAAMETVMARIRPLISHDYEGWLTASIRFDLVPYVKIL